MKKEVYLGDGLYAGFDGFMYYLITDRDNGTHYVALEPDVLMTFIKYIEKKSGVTITIKKVEEVPE